MNYMMQGQNPLPAKKILTKLAEGVRNDGFDNADGDYICRVGDIICSPEGVGFEIVEKLGHGTFGQVMKCNNNMSGTSSVAIKIIKNKPAYYQQGLVEVRILDVLNRSFDLRVVKMLDYFVFRKHLCIVFELLSVNLYDVIKHNSFRGLPFTMVRSIVDQLVRSLMCLRLSNVLHCDLKPENILLLNKKNTKIKLIDFGSASFVGQQVYTYIQSRFYRSIDVIIGFTPFTAAIDMWSLGCIIIELFTGMPAFPGQSEYDQLCKIVDLLGPIPNHLLESGKHTRKFYSKTFSDYRFRSKEEYEEVTGRSEKPARKHVKANNLRDLIMNTPLHREDSSPEDLERREKIFSFASLCLEYDPQKRLTPAQAVNHPLFDDTMSIVGWVPKSDSACTRDLTEDPNSFVNNSSSNPNKPMDSSGISIGGGTDMTTPIKPPPSNTPVAGTNPLQPRNAQSVVQFSASKFGGTVDDYSANHSISYRPQINHTSAGTPYKLQQSSPHSGKLPPMHGASPRIIGGNSTNSAIKLPHGGTILFSPAGKPPHPGPYDVSPPAYSQRARAQSDAQLFVNR